MFELCEKLLGMHYNQVGTIYITAGPLLVYLALRPGVLGKLNLAFAFGMLLVIQSRSALLAFAIAVVITLIVLRRTLVLTAGAIIAALILVIWQGPTTAALLSVGVSDGDGFSLDGLLTGRVNAIWGPLLDEWFSDPLLLVFGAGRYGIVTSPLWRLGEIMQTTHAHNAFVDFFLDNGIVLTFALIAAIIWWLVWTWRIGRAMQSALFWALFMCPVAYLMGTLTERQFFPAVDNMFLFPILAVTLNVIRVWALAPAEADEAANSGSPELAMAGPSGARP
jgi:O-antigen ligase